MQVYVSVANSKVDRHVKALKGFARVSLEAGEEKEIEISIPSDGLKYYDEETSSWILEQTDYDLLVGPNADPEQLTTVKVNVWNLNKSHSLFR